MKKTLFALLCAIMCSGIMHAQNVITHHYKLFPDTSHWGIHNNITEYLYNDTTLEAESLTYYGAEIRKDHKGYTGSGYVDGKYNAKNAYIQYSLNNPSIAKCKISITAAGSYPCNLLVNDKIVHSYQLPASASWDTWNSSSSPDIYLPEGECTIAIQAASSKSLPNIDKITIDYQNDQIWSFACDEEFEITNFNRAFPVNGNTPVLNGNREHYEYLTAAFFAEESCNVFIDILLWAYDVAIQDQEIRLNGQRIDTDYNNNKWQYAAFQTLAAAKGLNVLEIKSSHRILERLNIVSEHIKPIDISKHTSANIVFDKAENADTTPWFVKAQGVIQPYFVNEDTLSPQTTYSGYNRGGYYDFPYNKSTGLQLVLYTPESTSSYLYTRYALQGENRNVTITDQHGNRITSTSFAPTGSWNSWKTDYFHFELPAGINILNLKGTSDKGLPNIDHMELKNYRPNNRPIYAINNIINDKDLKQLKTIFEKGNTATFATKRKTPVAVAVEYSNLSAQKATINCMYQQEVPGYQIKNTLLFEDLNGFEDIKTITATASSDSVKIHSIRVFGIDLHKASGDSLWNVLQNDSTICTMNFIKENGTLKHSGGEDNAAAIFNYSGSKACNISITYNALAEGNAPQIYINEQEITNTLTASLPEGNNSLLQLSGNIPVAQGTNIVEITANSIDIHAIVIKGADILPIQTDCYKGTYYSTAYHYWVTSDIYEDEMHGENLNIAALDGKAEYCNFREFGCSNCVDNYYNFEQAQNKGFAYNFYSAENAVFEINMRYSGQYRTARLLVDNQVVDPLIEFPATPYIQEWEIANVTFNIAPGIHNIRMESTMQEGMPYIDEIEIHSTGEYYNLSNSDIEENTFEWHHSTGNTLLFPYDENAKALAVNVEYTNLSNTFMWQGSYCSVNINAEECENLYLLPHRYRANLHHKNVENATVGSNLLEVLPSSDSVKIHSVSVLIYKNKQPALKNEVLESSDETKTVNPKETIAAFYNSSSKTATVSIHTQTEQACAIQIVNTEGKIVAEKKAQTAPGTTTYYIPMTQAQTGIYYIKVQASTVCESKTFFVE